MTALCWFALELVTRNSGGGLGRRSWDICHVHLKLGGSVEPSL